jgi:hypothetical protein
LLPPEVLGARLFSGSLSLEKQDESDSALAAASLAAKPSVDGAVSRILLRTDATKAVGRASPDASPESEEFRLLMLPEMASTEGKEDPLAALLAGARTELKGCCFKSAFFKSLGLFAERSFSSLPSRARFSELTSGTVA